MTDRIANYTVHTIHMYILCECRGERHLEVCNAYPHSNLNPARVEEYPISDI